MEHPEFKVQQEEGTFLGDMPSDLKGSSFWPHGNGKEICQKNPSSLQLHFKLKGLIQKKNNRPFCQQPASFGTSTEHSVQGQNLLQR